jgi:Flp pilus assembly protein TadG
MRIGLALIRNDRGAAAAEMALVVPLVITLMYASMELGNFFLIEHAVTKQVRDGARFASRMTLAEAYNCPGTVFEDANYATTIANVTRTGSVDGSATGRFSASFWNGCGSAASPITVSIRCVPQDDYAGIYTGLDGAIPVVTVSASVDYPSVFQNFGFTTTGYCMRAKSEAAVAGL